MEDILDKKVKEHLDLSTDKEIKEYAYNWVLFQYKLEELNNFIDRIREQKVLKEDSESENGLFVGVKGNNTYELENDLRDYFLNEYM
jgi:hypothetical protein